MGICFTAFQCKPYTAFFKQQVNYTFCLIPICAVLDPIKYYTNNHPNINEGSLHLLRFLKYVLAAYTEIVICSQLYTTNK